MAVSASWSEKKPVGLIHYMIHYTLMHIKANVEGGMCGSFRWKWGKIVGKGEEE